MVQNKVTTISVNLSKIIIFSLFLSISTVQADTILSAEEMALLTKINKQADELIESSQYDAAIQVYQQVLQTLKSKLPEDNDTIQTYTLKVLDLYRDEQYSAQAPLKQYYSYISHEKNDLDRDQYEKDLKISIGKIQTAIAIGKKQLDILESKQNIESKKNTFLYKLKMMFLYTTENMIYMRLGDFFSEKQDYSNAEVFIEKAFESAQNSKTLQQQAYIAKQNWRTAAPLQDQVAIDKAVIPDDSEQTMSTAIYGLLDLYDNQGKENEANQLLLKLDEIVSKSPDDSLRLLLADTYLGRNKLDEAEKVYIQVLDNPNKSFIEAMQGDKSDDFHFSFQYKAFINLGTIYDRRYYESKNVAKADLFYSTALNYHKQAVAVLAKQNSPNLKTSYSQALYSLAAFYSDHDKNKEAVPYFKQTVDIQEQLLKTDGNSSILRGLIRTRHRMGINYRLLGDYDAAEQLYQKNIDEPNNNLLPYESGSVATSKFALAKIQGLKGNIPLALQYLNEAKKLYDLHQTDDAIFRQSKNQLAQLHLWLLFDAMHDNYLNSAEISAEALEEIQQIHGKKRTLALQQTAMRLAGNDQNRSQIVSQTLAKEWQQARQDVQVLNNELRQVFPVQKLLKPDEALLAWILGDGDALGVPEHTMSFLLVIRPERAKLIPLYTSQITLAPFLSAHMNALSTQAPVNLAYAHELYRSLLEPAEQELVGVKHIIAVPDETLKALPLQTLLKSTSKAADPVKPNNDDYASADWLLNHYAISYLPAVHSLAQLRERDVQPVTSAATGRVPFMGFGNPVLQGKKTVDSELLVSIGRSLNRGEDSTFATDTSKLRELEALPNTGSELEYAAELFGADSDTSLYLADKATETNLKGLSDQDTLAKADILAFATHAFGANDTLSIMPGLVLTPPAVGTAQDDGYLNVEEIPNLKLNAQWVVLAACETAKYAQQDVGQGLSQLVKAFFIAGTRSVLATHWSVNDAAAHELMNTLFKSLAEQPDLSRAEALRRAMQSVATQCNWRCTLGEWLGLAEQRQTAHPAYWGAFVIYGEGIQ